MTELEQARRIAAKIGDEGEIKPLSGGTSNAIFASDGFVYRIKRPHQVDEIDAPEREMLAVDLSMGCPCLPEVLYFDGRGNKAERRLKGVTVSQKGVDEADFPAIIKAIEQLHAMPESEYSFNLVERYRQYKDHSGIKGYISPFERNVMAYAFHRIEQFPHRLSHNDLWGGNIIIDGEQAKLIDLEFASTAPEVFDYLSFVEENGLTLGQAKSFFGLSGLKMDFDDFVLLTYALDIIWAYWALCRQKETGRGKDIARSKLRRLYGGRAIIKARLGYYVDLIAD